MSNLEKRIQVGACSASIFVQEVATKDGPVPMLPGDNQGENLASI